MEAANGLGVGVGTVCVFVVVGDLDGVVVVVNDNE